MLVDEIVHTRSKVEEMAVEIERRAANGWSVAVLALSTVVALELVRATGPLLELAFDVGVLTAAATAAVTFLGAGVVGLALTVRRANPRLALVGGIALLAVARLAVQTVTGSTRFVVGLVAIAIAVAVTTLWAGILAGRANGGAAVATAVALGAAAAVGLQLALGTWDAYWRHDTVGWVVTLAVLTCLFGATGRAARDLDVGRTRQPRRLWALGPVLGLAWMVSANAGFAASQSDVRLAVAGPVAAAGLVLAAVIAQGRRPSASSALLGPIVGLVLVVAVAGVFAVSGPVVLVLLVVAQVAAIVALALALEPASERPLSEVRVAAWASLVGLGTILPSLVFQLDYDIPLGFPNWYVIVAGALVLGLATVRRPSARRATVAPSWSDPSLRPVLGGVAAVVLIGSSLAVGRAALVDPDPPSPVAGEPLTLVSWNVHYGVGPEAGLDLEQIARTIEAHQPSIVTLQEVSRGWVLGGGADMATWLAERLDMYVAYAPAADRQFGNVVLTAFPPDEVTVVELPYGNGPQDRSAAVVDVVVPGGRLQVASVHLQNKGHVPTRLAQIETLLAEADASTVLIAGDFNSRPESEEVARMLAADLASAQDESGDPTALTDPSIEPDKRIDWVFGRGVSFVETEVLTDAPYSDHRALVVQLTVD